ncbi:MAG TPA: hypothetical protein PKB10_05540 [Tepidisphaeraceae bacterium]|nr:hypothetical protein [Tepidisphaeraceae bacterium]
MIRKTLTVLSFAVALVITSGCRNHKNIEHAAQIGAFKGDDEGRAIQDYARVQAANGARDDAMLRDHHFAGTRLNSLGRAKIDLMLADLEDSADPIELFLHLDEQADNTPARREAVVAYLNSRGATGDAVNIRSGANPAHWHSASRGLAAYEGTSSVKAIEKEGSAKTASEGGMESLINATPMK